MLLWYRIWFEQAVVLARDVEPGNGPHMNMLNTHLMSGHNLQPHACPLLLHAAQLVVVHKYVLSGAYPNTPAFLKAATVHTSTLGLYPQVRPGWILPVQPWT